MLLLAIDPGPLKCAYVLLSGPRKLDAKGIVDNECMRELLMQASYNHCVVEYTPPYTLTMGNGRAYVPRQVVDTAIEVGRLWQCADNNSRKFDLLSRLEVKKHLLGRTTGGDPDVRAALLDCWGCPSPREARGTVKAPGPLRGITKDLWAALGVAVTFWEQHEQRRRR